MHCDILSPARHNLSVHQLVICLLTFSFPLGTVMQLPSFAMKRYLFLCFAFTIDLLIFTFVVLSSTVFPGEKTSAQIEIWQQNV